MNNQEFVLPTNWHFKKLVDVCDINPTKKEIEFVNDNTQVSFLPMSGVSEKGVLLEMQTKRLAEVKKGFTYFRNGDVLFAKITPCMENGKRWLANSLISGIGFGSTEFHVLRPKSDVTSEWLYYFISRKSFRNEAEKNMTGTAGQKRVPRQFLEKTSVIIPPIEVQKRTTERLVKVEKLQQRREQANQLANRLLQVVFTQMFGNKPTANTIGDIAEFISSGSTPLGGQKTYLSEGIMFIRSQNVYMNEFRLDDVAYISEETHNKMKRTWLKNDDVLLNITGASLGRVTVYKGETNKANVNQHVCIIRVNKSKALPEYVSHYLSMPNAQREIWNNQAGASRQALNFQQVKKLSLLLPTIDEQKRFVTIVNKVSNIRENQRRSSKEIDSLFDSAMAKVFCR